jgi:hypothetical protein
MSLPKTTRYCSRPNDEIPEDIVNFIVKHTQYFNKAAFFLEGDRYYIDIETNLY